MKLINLQVKSFLNCSDFFRTMSVSPTNWAIDNKAYYIFDFHVISFIQTLLPFIILIWLNAFIVWKLLRAKRKRVNHFAFSYIINYSITF